MVVPAMQLASKIPDMSVQLWSLALLRGEYRSHSSSSALAWPSLEMNTADEALLICSDHGPRSSMSRARFSRGPCLRAVYLGQFKASGKCRVLFGLLRTYEDGT